MKNIIFCFIGLLISCLSFSANENNISKIQSNFREWDAALQTVAIDFGLVPKGDDILQLARYLIEYQYWEEPVLYDPFGNLYHFKSDGKNYTFLSNGIDGKFGTSDDLIFNGSIFEPLNQLKEEDFFLESSSIFISSTRSTSDSLRLSKSGDDIVFTWSGSGPTYDITGSTDPRFLNSYLLQKDSSGAPFTYTGALKNTKSIEFFDVTEPGEVNHGEDANGFYPPEPPSLNSTSGTWFIGNSVSLSGSNFSEVVKDNIICFSGGYCIHPEDTSTTTQLDLKVPPGAISGSITTGIGVLESNKLEAPISLEDPSLPSLTIRSLGFTPSMGDYYSGVLESGSNKMMRHYYNAGTGKWARENRSGAYTQVHYGSTISARNGNIYFGMATQSTGGGGTRVIVTSPPTNAANCYTIPSGGNSARVVGVAVDPNPEGIAGRDVFYALFEDVTANKRYIKKMYQDCSGIEDGDWGNQNGSWAWNALNGAAVDPKTGDLYVAEKVSVRVVRFSNEVVENFKSGFATNIYNIAVWREPQNDFGFLIVADNVAGNIKAIPLDNPSSNPIILATASSSRAVSTGLTTFNQSTYQASELNRLIVIHNDGSTIKIRKPPFFKTAPEDGIPVNIWVSSPEPTDKPTYQGVLRPSVGGGLISSTVKMKAYFEDDIARTICVGSGDPPSAAGFTDFSGTYPSLCYKPYKDPIDGTLSDLCDNSTEFTSGTAGSSTANNDFIDCRSNCGTISNPCNFEFRIGTIISEENYRYYFMPYKSRTVLWSFMANSWKRALIEQDKMCKRGGLLYDDFNSQTCSPNCDKIKVYSWTNVQLGDLIIVFDEISKYDGGEIKTVTAITENGDGTTTITLDSNLTKSYLASFNDGATPPNPTFLNGHSGGFCVPSAGFYAADSSQLNRREKTGAFDDAFVKFYASNLGSGVVPYWSSIKLNYINEQAASMRFHQIWFSNNKKAGCYIDDQQTYWCDTCCNWPNNYFHLMGVAQSDTGNWGDSISASDISWIHIDSIISNCPGCASDEIQRGIRHTTSHESGHQYNVNCFVLQGSNQNYHDNNDVWCGNCGSAVSQKCVMSIWQSLQDRIDGIDRFCCYNLINIFAVIQQNVGKG